MCLAVTYHLHFWQNDRDRLRAAAVTRRWNGHRNKSARKVDPEEENDPRHSFLTQTEVIWKFVKKKYLKKKLKTLNDFLNTFWVKSKETVGNSWTI